MKLQIATLGSGWLKRHFSGVISGHDHGFQTGWELGKADCM
jgi:hypothetical protein